MLTIISPGTIWKWMCGGLKRVLAVVMAYLILVVCDFNHQSGVTVYITDKSSFFWRQLADGHSEY